MFIICISVAFSSSSRWLLVLASRLWLHLYHQTACIAWRSGLAMTLVSEVPWKRKTSLKRTHLLTPKVHLPKPARWASMKPNKNSLHGGESWTLYVVFLPKRKTLLKNHHPKSPQNRRRKMLQHSWMNHHFGEILSMSTPFCAWLSPPSCGASSRSKHRDSNHLVEYLCDTNYSTQKKKTELLYIKDTLMLQLYFKEISTF